MTNRVVLAAMVLAVSTSACGGSAEPAQAPAAEATPVATEPVPAPAPSAPAAAPEATPAPAPTAEPSATPAEAAPTPAPADAPASSGTAEISDIQVAGGVMSDAERVVQGMRVGFRNCYARGLGAKSDAQGDVTLTIRVGAAGQVLGVTAQRTTLVPQTVVSCITGRAGAASFAPPTGTKKKVDTTVALKVTLKP